MAVLAGLRAARPAREHKFLRRLRDAARDAFILAVLERLFGVAGAGREHFGEYGGVGRFAANAAFLDVFQEAQDCGAVVVERAERDLP